MKRAKACLTSIHKMSSTTCTRWPFNHAMLYSKHLWLKIFPRSRFFETNVSAWTLFSENDKVHLTILLSVWSLQLFVYALFESSCTLCVWLSHPVTFKIHFKLCFTAETWSKLCIFFESLCFRNNFFGFYSPISCLPWIIVVTLCF